MKDEREGIAGPIMVTGLTEEMKKCTIKPVNYDKIEEVTQEKLENPVLFGDDSLKLYGSTPAPPC